MAGGVDLHAQGDSASLLQEGSVGFVLCFTVAGRIDGYHLVGHVGPAGRLEKSFHILCRVARTDLEHVPCGVAAKEDRKEVSP